jgi:hypothetical protein
MSSGTETLMTLKATGKPVTGYLVGGATAGAGLQQAQIQAALPYTVFGMPLSEVALIIGCIGVLGNLLFTYLSYRRAGKRDRDYLRYHEDHEATDGVHDESVNDSEDG